MDQTDISIINTEDNEDLGNYFETKKAGEPCTLTIVGTFMGLEEGNARISIEEVELTNLPDEDKDVDEQYEEDMDSLTGAELVLGGAEDDE